MGHGIHGSRLFTGILNDFQQYSASPSLALTYVNLLANLADLSGSNDEFLPSDSWLAKVGMLGSPQEIRLPGLERTQIRDAESTSLISAGEIVERRYSSQNLSYESDHMKKLPRFEPHRGK
jgi:hypothetical protein